MSGDRGRLDGVANKNYDQDFYLKARVESTETYHLRDFKVPMDSPGGPRHLNEETALWVLRLSQPEHDWAYAKRAVARCDEPEETIRKIADFRAGDKPDPEYYARHTVAKAQAELERETAPTSGSGQGQLGETERNY